MWDRFNATLLENPGKNGKPKSDPTKTHNMQDERGHKFYAPRTALHNKERVCNQLGSLGNPSETSDFRKLCTVENRHTFMWSMSRR